MKTSFKPALKSKNLSISKSYILLPEKDTSFINFKFYQKLFVLLVSFSIILIFPDSPRELENICMNYKSAKICNVW